MEVRAKYTIIIACVLALLSLCPSKAVAIEGPADSLLVKRLFTLLYVLDKDAASKKSIKEDKILNTLAAARQQGLNHALNRCGNIACLTAGLKLKDAEISLIGDRLARLTGSGHIPHQLIKKLKTSNAYFNYQQLPDSSLVRAAWNDISAGMNRIFEVYLSGKKPRYPAIDSISFNAGSTGFLHLLKKELRKAAQPKSRIIYELPLQMALKALAINGRDEAARYEPLTAGLNAAVFAAAQQTDWSGYPYTAILVPGFGPEEAGIRIDHRSVARSKMAAERFRKGLAPFIIVSGGHVYPAKTPFSEAIEMKKYMVEVLGLPANAIIVEPHARHTTTNIRNASRLAYRFNLPQDKPLLVVTDEAQTKMIVNLAQRCKRELGYVPFRELKGLSTEESSFYPVMDAFQVNVQDPLDP